MRVVANKRLIPINTEEARALSRQLARMIVEKRDDWRKDGDVLDDAEAEYDVSSIDNLRLDQIGTIVGRRLARLDTTIIPTIGLPPPHGTREFYQWMARARWKKPLSIEVFTHIPSKSSKIKRGSFSAGKSTIRIYIPNLRVSDLQERRLETLIYRTLVHELTHAADPDRKTRKTQEVPYGDRPREVRATARQLAEEMSDLVVFAEGVTPSERFWNALDRSRYWKRLLRGSSDYSQRMALEYVYSDLSSKGLLEA